VSSPFPGRDGARSSKVAEDASKRDQKGANADFRSSFGFRHSFVIRHSSFVIPSNMSLLRSLNS
jgi:hypothetical protein